MARKVGERVLYPSYEAASAVDSHSTRRLSAFRISFRAPREQEIYCFLFMKNRSGPSDDLFPFCVPLDGTFLMQRSDSHLAGDGGTEAELEGAVGFFAAADTIKEITHVSVGVRFVRADDIGLASNL